MDNGARKSELEGHGTQAVHAGRFPETLNVPSSPPLYQASSYEFADLGDVDAIYSGERGGSIYGRYGGPNGAHFESAVAELEDAAAAVGAASGMAAINAALVTSLVPGMAIVCANELYGGTLALLENDFQQNGHAHVPVPLDDVVAIDAALEQTQSRVLYVEALSNPLMHVADMPRLAQIAHAHGAALIVDATFATPVLMRPLDHGADLVVHSVGKYLGGHGDVGAGVVAGDASRCAAVRGWLVRNGATIPHFEAWLALRGMRTLGLRMERHSANARTVAAFLATLDVVARVHHPSLPGHPQHALARELYPAGTGGIVAFDLHGGRAEVEAFLGGLQTIAIVHSLGEVASTISYSALGSHRGLTPAQRAERGVTDATLRLSCGIEDAPDIVADLARAASRLRIPGARSASAAVRS